MKRIWPFAFSFLFFASVASVSPYTVLYYRGLGFTGAQIGLLTGITPLITLFSVPLWTTLADVTRRPRLVKRFKPYGLLTLTMVVTVIRFFLLVASATPNLVLFVQLLNGLTFPAMWVAGVSYAHEHAPAGMHTTAQGIFGATVFGLGTAVGGFTGGLLLESVGGRGLYFVFGVVLLAIVAIATLIQGRLPVEQKTSPHVVMH